MSKKDELDPDSSSSKALFTLTRWSYDKFEKNLKASLKYKKIPVHEGDSFVRIKIVRKDGDPSTSIFIPVGERCLLAECIAMDNQCCHKLVNDGDFILGKWGTRYWCDDTY